MFKKLARQVLLVLLVVITGIMFSGCGAGTESTNNQGQPGQAEKVDVARGILPQKYKGTTISVLVCNPVIEKLVPEFEKLTGIDVLLSTMSYTEVHDKLALDFAGKTGGYDAFSYVYQWYGEFVDANDALEPLDEWAKKPGFPELKLEDYVPTALNTYGKYNGKLYGLPIVGDVEFLMYNKAMFEKAGIKEPPKTWDELAEMGKKLTVDTDGDGKIDQYGFGLMGGRSAQAAGTFFNLFYAHGGRVFDSEMKPQFNSPAGVKALSLMANELKAIAPPDCNTWDFPENMNAFMQGKTAMALFWPGAAGFVKDPSKSRVADQVGFALSPNNSSLLGGWAMGINKHSKNKEAAYLFISWLTSPEIQVKYARAGGGPTRKSILYNEELVKDYPWFPVIAENLAVAKPFPHIPETEEIIRYCYEAGNDVVTGVKTPELASEELNNRTEKLLDKHGYYKN
jgi:multiple sugar transport system substrate-binding protein